MKKVVLITGASRGVGASMATLFAQNDFCVAINYNKSENEANKLANQITTCGGTAICVKADVSNFNDCKQMVENVIKTFGHIDVLINNAGIASYNILIDETPNNIANIINTNLVGTINCTKLVAENMLKNDGGRIINISSIWGEIGASGESVYSATKGAIIAFTKAMAKELAYNNITVNCISPGIVETDMLNNLTQKEKQELLSLVPLNRLAKPEDVAELALFLASNNSNYITGQIISVNGGIN